MEAAILKYKNHPSLNAIRGKIPKIDNPNFDFEYRSLDQTLKELEKLDPKKAKVIQENKDIVAFSIYHNFSMKLVSNWV